MTLKFSGEDSTTRTVPPARSTSQASSVARARIAAIDRQGGLERLAPEGLRRLDRPQTRAVERGHDRAVVAGLLDRVHDPCGGDRAVRALELGDDPREQVRRDERSRRVVHHDRAGARRGLQRRPHRLRARRTAAHADAPVGRVDLRHAFDPPVMGTN